MDWLLERLREDSSTSLRFVPTRHQSADILTKATFVAPQWGRFCKLFGLYPKFETSGSTIVAVSVIGGDGLYSYIGDPGSLEPKTKIEKPDFIKVHQNCSEVPPWCLAGCARL